MPGWNKKITQIETSDQVPRELNDFVAFIEKSTAIPVKLISVGPDRKQTILR